MLPEIAELRIGTKNIDWFFLNKNFIRFGVPQAEHIPSAVSAALPIIGIIGRAAVSGV